MNYQLFADGTMNILVDGKVERRRCQNVERRGGMGWELEPELKQGEHVVRCLSGDMEIITFERSER